MAAVCKSRVAHRADGDEDGDGREVIRTRREEGSRGERQRNGTTWAERTRDVHFLALASGATRVLREGGSPLEAALQWWLAADRRRSERGTSARDNKALAQRSAS